MQDIVGSKTSVYVGAFLREYQFLLSRDPQMKQKHKASGTAFAMLANRLSWFFDLMGPSLALDTACSSSLYALHLACQSLRSGESTMVSLVAASWLCLLTWYYLFEFLMMQKNYESLLIIDLC
jgi:acyl transferase domain-containing protein